MGNLLVIVFHSGHLPHLLKLSGQPQRRQKTLTVVKKPSPLATFFGEVLSDTDHTIRCARRRSSSFVKASEGESQSRADHAGFFFGGLNLTRQCMRARGALSGNALPPLASLDAVQPLSICACVTPSPARVLRSVLLPFQQCHICFSLLFGLSQPRILGFSSFSCNLKPYQGSL